MVRRLYFLKLKFQKRRPVHVRTETNLPEFLCHRLAILLPPPGRREIRSPAVAGRTGASQGQSEMTHRQAGKQHGGPPGRGGREPGRGGWGQPREKTSVVNSGAGEPGQGPTAGQQGLGVWKGSYPTPWVGPSSCSGPSGSCLQPGRPPQVGHGGGRSRWGLPGLRQAWPGQPAPHVSPAPDSPGPLRSTYCVLALWLQPRGPAE